MLYAYIYRLHITINFYGCAYLKVILIPTIPIYMHYRAFDGTCKLFVQMNYVYWFVCIHFPCTKITARYQIMNNNSVFVQ